MPYAPAVPSAPVAPVTQPPTVTYPQPPSIWQQLGAFHAKHWRIIWTVMFALAPFGSLGDETVYTSGAMINALKFLGILVPCWAAAAGFFTLHLKHRDQHQGRVR